MPGKSVWLPAQKKSPLAVGRFDDRVRAMFAAALEFFERDDLVELVIAVGVEEAVNPGPVLFIAIVDGDIKTVEGITKPVSHADFQRDRLDRKPV